MDQHNDAKKLKPFDNTLMDDLSMYDKMPYKSNYDLCNSNTVCLESGNLLKAYRVKEKDPYIIEQDENRFKVTKRPQIPIEDIEEPIGLTDDSESLTPEQLESLLENNSDDEEIFE